MGLLRRFWPLVALLAGVMLAYFEIRRAGGVSADNIFWLIVAGLIIVLALFALFHKPPVPSGEKGGATMPPPPPPPD